MQKLSYPFSEIYSHVPKKPSKVRDFIYVFVFKSSMKFSSVNCFNDVFSPFIFLITTFIMNYVGKKVFFFSKNFGLVIWFLFFIVK